MSELSERLFDYAGKYNDPISSDLELAGHKLQKQAEQIAELEKAKNTLYKLKCECDKCGNVWTEQLYPVRAE